MDGAIFGTGSAVLFLCWIELESGLGGRVALVELAGSLCAAFAAVPGAGLYPDGPACRAGTPDGVF